MARFMARWGILAEDAHLRRLRWAWEGQQGGNSRVSHDTPLSEWPVRLVWEVLSGALSVKEAWIGSGSVSEVRPALTSL